MISKKQLEPKRRKKTGRKILMLAIIIVIALVLAVTVPPLFQPKTIEIGDCTEVQYIGKFAVNGTVFTTTYDDAINKTGGIPHNLFVNPNKNLAIPSGCGATYRPAYVPPEVIRALVGMKEGETKNITLSPEEAYGDWNISLAAQYEFGAYPVNEIWDTTVENFPTSEFSYYFPGVELLAGTIFDYWAAIALELEGILNAKITKIANDNVTFKMLPINGTTFTAPIFNWTDTILVTNNTAFTIHSDISVNHTFSFQDPDSNETVYGEVVSVNETEATFAFNAKAPSIEFIGQSLVYEFTVVKITKTAD
ncbi:MAG: FKBP-type peptidyl-prolyl cis-trans isomerase [Euryarchaeota archaeon]|nr:FKBP-type peptidyl-prolyl cis-trans isomerase [Euryarchaeota archaeon]